MSATILTDLNGGCNAYVRLLARALESADAGLSVTRFRPRTLLTAPRPALWHLHWPENLATRPAPVRAALDGLAFRFALRAARLRGVPIVWTVHNLNPHERNRARLAEATMRSVVRRLDGWISLSEAAVPLAVERFPRLTGLPRLVVPHGHYAHVYPPAAPAAEARSALGVEGDARVLLFFGRIRPYKKVPQLLHAFRSLPDPRLRLVVAGEPSDRDARRAVEHAARQDPRVRLRLHRVPDDHVPLLFGAADGAVLPADRILNSGSVLLALSFGIAALVPDTPVLRELRTQVGPESVQLYAGAISAQALAGFVARLPQPRAPIIESARETHDWRRIGSATALFFRSLLQGGKRGL